MKALALLLVVLALPAAAQTGRFDRFNSRTPQGRSTRGLAGDPGYAFFEFAPFSGAGMGTACACAAVTGAKGEALTFTRASVGECYSNDGQSLTQCSSNQPRVSSGSAASSWLGLWSEQSDTNLVTQSRDLSQAVWTKTNMTCALTATGMRGGANTASTCTATAGNGTALQAVVVAAATRVSSLHIKRRTGTGVVEVTRDNGTTWSAITSSLSSTLWRRVVPDDTPGCAGGNCIIVAAMKSGIANPTIGIRLGTSGDAVDIDFVQDEAGEYATSPIATAAASATRAAESATATYAPSPIRSISAYVTVRPLQRTFSGFFAAYQANTDFLGVYVSANGGTAASTPGCGLFVGGVSTVGANNPLTWSSENPLFMGCDVADGATITNRWKGMTTSTVTALTTSNTSVAYIGTAGPATFDNVDGVIKGLCMDRTAGRCAGGSFQSTASPIAVLGDSIALGYIGGGLTGPPSELQRLTGRLTYNNATGGHGSAECLDDYRTRVAGKGYTTLIAHCGINGINQGLTAAATWPAMLTLLDEARAAGMQIRLGDIMAWSNNALWNGSKQTETDAWNALVAAYCAAWPAQVTCVGNYNAMRTGTALSAAYDSGDGLHLNAAGNTALATLWQAANP